MPVPPQSVRASVARNRLLGRSSLYTTVRGSGACTDSTLTAPRPSNSLAQRQPVASAVSRCQDQSTSADVSGAPLWNRMPSRSVKV